MARPQWLCWKFVTKDGAKKPSKIPYYATTGETRKGGQGDESDRANLVDYDTAMEAAALRDFDGVGFAFLPGDGLIGIDLDGCFNTDDAERENRARSIISACGSYTELSPSGNGAHIIVKGETQTFKSNELGIEVFCGRQFFTVTGQPMAGTPSEVSAINAEVLEKLRRTVKGAQQATPAPARPAGAQGENTAAKIESALAMINPDCGYDDWMRVGMAINNELGDAGLSVWDYWSSRGTKYSGSRDLEGHWRSFKGDGVTVATLFKMAMDAGWRPPKPVLVAQAPARSVDPETGAILPDAPTPSNDNGPADAWGQPIDIFGVQQPPALPYDVLPDSLVAYVRDQSGLTGCDPAIIGMGALVAAAACITDGIKLQPKRHDPTWTESARLWVAFVGDPSTKKSPAISKAVRHVKRLDHRMAEENAATFSDYKWQHDAWKDAKKADKNAASLEPEKPATKRLLVEDITVEALTEVLKDNPRGVLTLKDELTGWFASMDAYKGANKGASMDRAHWLEAYNGGRRSIDRITRGTVIVPNWSTCIIGGVQPDMIRRVASGMGNDGLLQRFMVIVARPAVLDDDRAPDLGAMDEFGRLFDKLEALGPADTVVRLTESAHQSRERVAKYAKRLIDALDHPHLQAWLGKWDGLYARLLLLYHVIECAGMNVYPTSRDVTADVANKVERLLCGVLLHHAIHFYTEVVDANDKQEHIRQLGRLILAKGYTRITKRDITVSWKASRRMEWWELRQVIDAMCTMDWLQPDMMAIDTDGKPRAWHVNQQAHTKFSAAAQREIDRRRDAVEAMRELRSEYASED